MYTQDNARMREINRSREAYRPVTATPGAVAVHTIRERTARTSRLAEIDRLRKENLKQQVRMTSPWKRAWDVLMRHMKQATV